MLEIIDDINNSNLSSSAILVSFDEVKMFPSIDNNMGIVSVRKYLGERECKDFPTDCVIDVIELFAGTLIINTIIFPISLYNYVSSSLRKYIVFLYDDCNAEDIFGGKEKY